MLAEGRSGLVLCARYPTGFPVDVYAPWQQIDVVVDGQSTSQFRFHGGGSKTLRANRPVFLDRTRGMHTVKLVSGISVVMTTNQNPGIAVDLAGVSRGEASWGFGFGIAGHEAWPRFGGGLSSPRIFRHGGAGGIDGWIDPDTGVVAVYIEIVTEDEAGLPVSWAAHRFQDVINTAVDA